MDKLGHPDRLKDGNKVTRKKVKMREGRGRERTIFKRAENTQKRRGQVNSWTSMHYFACFSSLHGTPAEACGVSQPRCLTQNPGSFYSTMLLLSPLFQKAVYPAATWAGGSISKPTLKTSGSPCRYQLQSHRGAGFLAADSLPILNRLALSLHQLLTLTPTLSNECVLTLQN